MKNTSKRLLVWAAIVALILLVPLGAMQFTDEVNWSPSDFVVAGALLFGAAVTYEFMTGSSSSVAYRIAGGIAVAAALLLVWVNLAVGIIGHEGDPANLMYLGVIAVGIIGSAAARFRAKGMAYTLFSMAVAIAMIGIYASLAGLGMPYSPPLEILGLTGFFTALFAVSCFLFFRASEQGRA